MSAALQEVAADTPPVPQPRRVNLELALHPDDLAALRRAPEMMAARAGRPRIVPVRRVWHDTASGALAQAGYALCEHRAGAAATWRVEPLWPRPVRGWPPGAPAPVMADAPDPQAALAQALGQPLGDPLVATMSFDGETRTIPLAPESRLASLRVQAGRLRGVTAEQDTCRLLIDGPADAVFSFAHALTQTVRLEIPRASLAAEARALASGRPPSPRHLGAPDLAGNADPGEAFATIVGQLGDVILHWAPFAGAGATPNPVHQMRVALRRLRSAFKLFREVAACPAFTAAEQDLRALSRVMGPARDWDVFTAGLGPSVAAALPGEAAIARMLSAAQRQRRASYAVLDRALSDSAFRCLGLRLAELAMVRPWEADVTETMRRDPPRDLPGFARHALARRIRHVTAAADDLRHRSAAELHALRIECKRLRYAAEFFAPLFADGGARRYIRRLSAVQEHLGHVNDGAVAGELMRQLGGGHRGFAAGAVHGFVAARSEGAREEAVRSWQRFRQCERFWS